MFWKWVLNPRKMSEAKRVKHFVTQAIFPRIVELHGPEETSGLRLHTKGETSASGLEGVLVWGFLGSQQSVDDYWIPLLDARRMIHADKGSLEGMTHYAAKIDLVKRRAMYSGLVHGRFHTRHYFYDFLGDSACRTLLHLYEHPFPPTRGGRIIFSVALAGSNE